MSRAISGHSLSDLDMLLETERPPSFELKIKKQNWMELTPWNSIINCVFSRRLASCSFSLRSQNKESISSAIYIHRISNLFLIHRITTPYVSTFGIHIKYHVMVRPC